MTKLDVRKRNAIGALISCPVGRLYLASAWTGRFVDGCTSWGNHEYQGQVVDGVFHLIERKLLTAGVQS